MSPMSRRRTAAVLLLAWIPLALGWALVWPPNPDNTTAAFASAAAHHGAWELAGTLFAVSFAVAVPGLVAMLGLAAGKGRRLIAAGSLLAAAGFVCATIAGTFSSYQAVLAAEPDRATMVRAWNALDGLPVVAVASALIVIGHIGLVLLAFGIWRARRAGLWVPVVMTVGLLVETLIGPASHWAEVGAVALVGAALTGLARALAQVVPAGELAEAPAEALAAA